MFDDLSFTLNGCDGAIAMIGTSNEEIYGLLYDVTDRVSKKRILVIPDEVCTTCSAFDMQFPTSHHYGEG